MYPNSIRFTAGNYKDLVFNKGIGPTSRQIIDGVKVLINSTNFWYNGSIRLSADYLKNNNNWVEV